MTWPPGAGRLDIRGSIGRLPGILSHHALSRGAPGRRHVLSEFGGYVALLAGPHGMANTSSGENQPLLSLMYAMAASGWVDHNTSAKDSRARLQVT